MYESGVGVAELQAHQTASAGLCAALDPDSGPLPEVGAAYASVAHLARLVGARTRRARRVDESRAWQRRGVAVPPNAWPARTG